MEFEITRIYGGADGDKMFAEIKRLRDALELIATKSRYSNAQNRLNVAPSGEPAEWLRLDIFAQRILENSDAP